MSSLEERVDRLESIEAIRDLAARYAVTLDERDLDGLMELFVEDVKASRDAPPGREHLRKHYEALCDKWGYSVHQVFHQVIDFETPDKATGRVYCRAEHETPSAGTVAIAMLRYLDRYERRDGRWCFRWRRTAQWYVKQDPDAPQAQPRIHWPNEEPRDAALPEMIDTFNRYYETRGSGR
jgi:ketosteroid isomerase-like protein